MIKKKGFYLLNIFLLTLSFIIFFVYPTLAKKLKIQYGDLGISTGIDYSGSYNTNIYSDETNKESDFIHTITPSFQIEKKFASHNLFTASYSTGLVVYNNFEENNSQDHNASLVANIKFPALKLSLDINENLSRTSNLFGTEDNEYGKGKKTSRWNNTTGFNLGYDFGNKYSIELIYQNDIQRFDDDDDKWQNHFNHQYSISLSYQLTGKTSCFAQFQQTMVEYEKQNDGILGWNSSTSQDHTLNDYSVGLRFKPIGRLDGTVSLGYGTITYDNEIDRYGNPYQDDSSWIAATSLNYKMSKTHFSYTLERDYKGSADLYASSYVDTTTGISAIQEIGPHITVGLGFDWGYMDYSNGKSFNKYTANTKVDWEIFEKLTVGVGYEYDKKKADDARYEDDGYEISEFFLSIGFSISF